MLKFGLLGKNISYSFSKTYFSKKFKKANLPYTYENFDISCIELFPKLISETTDLKGLSVTIPYKVSIIPFLDSLDYEAKKIGAVNTVKISDEKKLIGYNTDHLGFQRSLEEYLPLQKKTALILGTGGASKAIAYALDKLGFEYIFVSRTKDSGTINYSTITKEIIESNLLIVNCTPLGTFPNISDCPSIPYHFLTKNHLLFDLIYNPSETEFLRQGKLRGAKTLNGLRMLEIQAEEAWKIWNS